MMWEEDRRSNNAQDVNEDERRVVRIIRQLVLTGLREGFAMPSMPKLPPSPSTGRASLSIITAPDSCVPTAATKCDTSIATEGETVVKKATLTRSL